MTRKITIEIISSMFVVLFVYASVSKLLDYSTFTYQISLSPLLKGHESTISWLVPGMELLTVLLLLFPTTRITGLFTSLLLMLLFTAYIALMLASKQHLPCSCGGILRKLSWKAHLIFNIVFLLISALGIYIELKQKDNIDTKNYLLKVN